MSAIFFVFVMVGSMKMMTGALFVAQQRAARRVLARAKAQAQQEPEPEGDRGGEAFLTS